jgi:tRNA1Val (adenine37-N6)-methyltransferase
MKVNTDAVLLGAWIVINKPNRILDIGTGSGIIAVMLAQRSTEMIDAIDIHEPSFNDASINFENCPWKERMQLYNLSFSDYLPVCTQKYDLVVSNPPFHNKSLKSTSEQVNISKHTTSLTHEELIFGVKKILNPAGRLFVILSYSEYQNFKQLSEHNGLHCQQECFVIPKTGKPANRVMIEFGWQLPVEIQISKITIRHSNGNYQESYMELTKDFYLNF